MLGKDKKIETVEQSEVMANASDGGIKEPVTREATPRKDGRVVEVQAITRTDRKNADKEVQTLQKSGFTKAYVRPHGWLFRVIAAKCGEGEAEGIAEKLGEAGYTPHIL